MAMFCLFAVLAGAVLSLWAPLAQFAIGLLGIAFFGCVLALCRGLPVGTVMLWTIAGFVLAQAGFVLGLGAQAAVRKVSGRKTRDGEEQATLLGMGPSIHKGVR